MFKKLFKCESDVFCDLAQQKRRDVPTRVKGYRCAPAVRMTILSMRTSPPHLGKAKSL